MMAGTTNSGGWTPPAGGPLWPGPNLLVPIAMDAFLIGDGNLATTYAATMPNYPALEIYAPVSTAPFSTTNPSVGVHLHWTLPHGLRHGRHVTDGDIVFPPAPNRWLLARLFYPASATPGTPPHITTWIILSDRYGPDVTSGTVPFPDPNNPGNIVYLGRKMDYPGWSEQAAGTTQWLTAMGPGDQAFAATFDASLNVFSALDTPPEANGSLTYLLFGWNANYPSDPLFGRTEADPNGWSTQGQWQSIMDDSVWQVADLQAAIDDWTTWRNAHPKVLNAPGQDALNPEQLVLPAQIVLHSMLLGIAWRGTVNQNYPPSLPTTPELAVGETGNEALAAWLAVKVAADPTKVATVEQLLLAIGMGTANQLAIDPVKVEDGLHSARFGNRAGGTVWVVQRPNDGASGPSDLGAQSVPLSPDQTRLLTDLNAAQLQIEQLDNAIAANQWELFAAYWKKLHVSPFDSRLKKLINDAITRLSAAVTDATKERDTQAIPARNSAKATLTQALGAEYALTTETAPTFRTGNDPLLLIAGINRSTVHDAPSR
jgi:hypothetical protein